MFVPTGASRCLAIGCAAAALACAGATAVEPPLAPAAPIRDAPTDPGAAAFTKRIAEIVSHDGKLWARGADGTLGAFDVARGELRHDLRGETLVDLHPSTDGGLLALTLDRDSDDVRVWRRLQDGWVPEAQMAAPAARLVGLADLKGLPVVLTDRAALILAPGSPPEATAMHDRIPAVAGEGTTFAVTDDAIGYVGSADGLLRVDLRAGAVEIVHDDAVTSIIVDPALPDCVLVGSVRLLRVCDRAATPVWRPVDDPVVALAPARDGFWMLTSDGVYRSRGRQFVRHEMPRLAQHGGVAMGSVAGAWVVATDATFTRFIAAAP